MGPADKPGARRSQNGDESQQERGRKERENRKARPRGAERRGRGGAERAKREKRRVRYIQGPRRMMHSSTADAAQGIRLRDGRCLCRLPQPWCTQPWPARRRGQITNKHKNGADYYSYSKKTHLDPIPAVNRSPHIAEVASWVLRAPHQEDGPVVGQRRVAVPATPRRALEQSHPCLNDVERTGRGGRGRGRGRRRGGTERDGALLRLKVAIPT